MLLREYNIRYKKNLPEVVLYAGDFLENLGFFFLKDFGTASAIDKATEQYINYLEYIHHRETNGY